MVESVDILLRDDSPHIHSKQVNEEWWRGYTVKGKMGKDDVVRSGEYDE